MIQKTFALKIKLLINNLRNCSAKDIRFFVIFVVVFGLFRLFEFLFQDHVKKSMIYFIDFIFVNFFIFVCHFN